LFAWIFREAISKNQEALMLTEFLDRYRVDWSKQNKHSRNGWTQIRECPQCHSQNYHLGIRDDMRRASCYQCGGKFVPKLLYQLTNAPRHEINALLGDRAFVIAEGPTAMGVYTPPTQLQPLREVPAVSAYLEDRGYDLDYLEQVWGMQATGNFSNYPRRAFIPIYHGRRLVAWTARAAVGQEPRYQTASPKEKSFHEKHLLFGNQFVRDTCIVVEGPLSAISIGRGTVATFGLAYTTEQVTWLADVWNRIIVFDNSPAAQQRAKELATLLSVFPGKTTRINLDADDPGVASDSEIDELRAFAGLPKER
jgi:hypothetical protein